MSSLPKCCFILRTLGCFLHCNQRFLVTELISGGELEQLLPLDLRQIHFYGASVILALQFLHSCHVGHFDLKGENFLGYLKSNWLRTGSASWRPLGGAQGERGPFHGARDHARQPWAGRGSLRTCGWCLELWNLSLLFLHVLHAICRWWEHSAWYLQYCLVPAWRAPWVRRVWRRWLGSYYSGVAVPASRRPPHLCWLAVWQLLSRNWLAQTLVQTAPRTSGPLEMKKRIFGMVSDTTTIDLLSRLRIYWRFFAFEQVLRRTWSASLVSLRYAAGRCKAK